MKRLTYTNSRGDSIVFYLSPFFIDKLTGIGEVDANLQSQKAPFQDGESHIDVVLQPRIINLEGTIVESDETLIKKYRRELSSKCNPKLGLGQITLELEGESKIIYGVMDGSPVFPDKGENVFQTFMITFKCPDPYWQDEQETLESLEAWIGTFTFPFSLPAIFGRKGTSKILNNSGDAPVPVIIKFNGPALNPNVINHTTGEFIKVNRVLLDGEVLEINTEFGNKSVEIVSGDGTRTNVFNWIDLNSTFFHLEIGENEIEYTADTGVNNALVNIFFRNRFIGM